MQQAQPLHDEGASFDATASQERIARLFDSHYDFVWRRPAEARDKSAPEPRPAPAAAPVESAEASFAAPVWRGERFRFKSVTPIGLAAY